ncbi:MAG: hypothetical protein EPO32_11755 [Anaerolineae bacterium]|nr:MAG: hypothetical protein EPO32_11755 [Anaerolineae bacterium]
MLSARLRRWWPLLLPPLMLLPGIGVFPYPAADARFSDFAVSHFPNALYIQRTLVNDHVVPFWSDLIMSGYPFYADPLSGLHYPPGWLALLFPLPFGLNLTALLHLVWGGVGMALFLRRLGLGARPALLGALAFQLMPKLWGHYGAGHLTLFYAFQWLPWLLWSALRSRVDGARHGLNLRADASNLLQPALFLALIFLADPRAVTYCGLLWLAFEFAYSQSAWKTAVRVAGQGLVALLLSAPLLFPLFGFLTHSTRSLMTPADVLAFSLPLTRLLGLLVPDFGATAEWVVYPGAAVIVLALAALLGRAPRSWLWGGAAAVALLWSLGEALPFAETLAGLPFVSLLRVPPRAVFVAGFALAVLAAHGFQQLLDGVAESTVRRLRLAIVGLAGLSLALAALVFAVTGALDAGFIWSAAVFSTLAALLLAYLAGRLTAPRFALAIFVLLAADLAAVDSSLFAMRPAQEVLAEGREVAEWLAAQPGEFRVYSPSYSIPQQTAADLGLHLADGVNPLQLAAYAEFMDRATGIPRTGYSVTIPPFDGDPTTANASFTPDARLLGELNVRYVVAEFPIDAEGLEFLNQFGRTHLYENQFASGFSDVGNATEGFPPELATGLVASLFGLLSLAFLPLMRVRR